MFNLQGSEIIMVLLLALVVLGPEKLPDAMRKMGKAYGELKKMSSGFQAEFKAVVDEPMREIRDTANVLRDSADFTKLQSGEREEKPKSADMLAPSDPDAVPSDTIPDFSTPTDEAGEDGPDLAADSKPAPFSGVSSTAPSSFAPVTMVPPPPQADEPTTGESEAADGATAPVTEADKVASDDLEAGDEPVSRESSPPESSPPESCPPES